MFWVQGNLTNREQEIYKYLLEGLSYADIGHLLNLQKPTVVSHIMSVYLKKMVANRNELMAQRIHELEDELKEVKERVNASN